MDVEDLRDWVLRRIKGIDFWQQISLMNVYSCHRGDMAMQLFIRKYTYSSVRAQG